MLQRINTFVVVNYMSGFEYCTLCTIDYFA